MKKNMLSAVCVSLSLLCASPMVLADNATSEVQQKPLKIAYLNLDKILQETVLIKELDSKLNAEFKDRDLALVKMGDELRAKYEKFQKDSPILSDEQRVKIQREITDMDVNFQRKRREFQEDVNRRRNEGLSQIISVADEVVKKIALEQDYDFILRTPLPYAKTEYDITQQIIDALAVYVNSKSKK